MSCLLRPRRAGCHGMHLAGGTPNGPGSAGWGDGLCGSKERRRSMTSEAGANLGDLLLLTPACFCCLFGENGPCRVLSRTPQYHPEQSCRRAPPCLPTILAFSLLQTAWLVEPNVDTGLIHNPPAPAPLHTRIRGIYGHICCF